MRIQVLEESGLSHALLGLSLNKNQPLDNMLTLSDKLASKDGGHNKFLESIAVWLDITAPRYWWSQLDTYRAGVTKQSESTMHTGMKRLLTQEDFENSIPQTMLDTLNISIEHKDFQTFKNLLPESFLQRRIVATNYKALRNIYQQRVTHNLPQWQKFCSHIFTHIERGEWLV